MACQDCEDSSCPGREKLREFADWDDLAAHASEATLVTWVNHYARLIQARDDSGKKYRLRQQMLAKVAQKYLDKDELERIAAEAEERLG